MEKAEPLLFTTITLKNLPKTRRHHRQETSVIAITRSKCSYRSYDSQTTNLTIPIAYRCTAEMSLPSVLINCQ